MKSSFLILLNFLFFLQISIVKNESHKAFPFWDETLSLGERLDDLMGRLTLQEMAEQMMNGGGVPETPAPGIERLGIPPYNFDSECLRGIPRLNSTAFPMPINMAATFSGDLAYQVASAVSTEARGVFNDASQKGDYGDMKGLNCFAPFVNLVRHPLWGRSQEVFGEDPFLVGVMGENYVRGLQGKAADDLLGQNTTDSHPLNGRYIRMVAGCKTFTCHSGPENIPSSRFTFDAKVGLRDFLLTYSPALQSCVEAGAQNVMCSYNSLNGVPTCASQLLLQDLLRKDMGFGGFVVSDMGAIENIFTGHNYTRSLKEAGVMAAAAGVDLNLHGLSTNAFSFIKEAVEEGSLSLGSVVSAVRRLYRARFLLGLFDPPHLNPYASIRMDEVMQSAYHRELAVEVAVRSVVMLKNINHTLPVKSFGRLSLIGPACDNLPLQFGGYSPNIMPEFSSTPYQALKQHATTTRLAKGCDDDHCNNYNTTEVVMATKGADFVVVCLGTGIGIESEDNDRPSLQLPGHQDQLLSDVMSHASAPITLITFTGCPIDLLRAKLSAKVSSILHAAYPGQAGGEALRRIMVVGSTKGPPTVTSPSGRLPITWPASMQQLPPMTDYSMRNRTYRYSTSTPLYPFGYGLSYSSFLYSDLTINPSTLHCTSSAESEGTNNVNNNNGDNNSNNNKCVLDDDDVIEISVHVTNTGHYDAEEVAQAYISWKDLPGGVEMPKLQLVTFQRVTLLTGSSGVRVVMRVKLTQLKVLNEDDRFVYLPGRIDVFVGGGQPHTTTETTSNILHSTITISNN